VRPQFQAEGSWFLLHDKAPSKFHTGSEDISRQTRCCGDKPPPYSPDPAPAKFILFPTMKTALKGKKFQDAEDIKKNVTAELNAVPMEAFADCFQKLFLFPCIFIYFFIPVWEFYFQTM
jgi:hypothetical protein